MAAKTETTAGSGVVSVLVSGSSHSSCHPGRLPCGRASGAPARCPATAHRTSRAARRARLSGLGTRWPVGACCLVGRADVSPSSPWLFTGEEPSAGTRGRAHTQVPWLFCAATVLPSRAALSRLHPRCLAVKHMFLPPPRTNEYGTPGIGRLSEMHRL